eukprot:1273132-Amphidinium_carterae.1
MTPDQQWNKELFNMIEVPMLDTTMKPDYSEEAVIGKSIIDQYFMKVRLNEKQAGHNLWANKKEVHNPPDLYNGEHKEQLNEPLQPPAEDVEPIQPPPGLEPPSQFVHLFQSNGKTDRLQTNTSTCRQTITTNRCTIG